MRNRFVRYLLWWGLVMLTMVFAMGIWSNPVGEQIPTGAPLMTFLLEGPVSQLPTYTVAELEAMRGSPIDPNDPGTLYYPPGVDSFEELPPCVPSTVDDPTTEINEDQVENERRLRDGSTYRNAQVRVVVCRHIPDPTSGISMTVEEYDRWWAEQHAKATPTIEQSTSPLGTNP